MASTQKPTIIYSHQRTGTGRLRAPTTYYGPAPTNAPTTQKHKPMFVIRFATVADALRIAALDMPSHNDKKPKAEDVKSWLEGYKDSPTNCMFVAVEGDKVLGMLNGRVKDTRTTMAHKWTIGLTVDAKYHRCGIGRKLLLHAIDYVRDHSDLKKICLSVLARNNGALNLYRSIGFKEEGRLVKDIYESRTNTYLDNVFMGIWAGD